MSYSATGALNLKLVSAHCRVVPDAIWVIARIRYAAAMLHTLVQCARTSIVQLVISFVIIRLIVMSINAYALSRMRTSISTLQSVRADAQDWRMEFV